MDKPTCQEASELMETLESFNNLDPFQLCSEHCPQRADKVGKVDRPKPIRKVTTGMLLRARCFTKGNQFNQLRANDRILEVSSVLAGKA